MIGFKMDYLPSRGFYLYRHIDASATIIYYLTRGRVYSVACETVNLDFVGVEKPISGDVISILDQTEMDFNLFGSTSGKVQVFTGYSGTNPKEILETTSSFVDLTPNKNIDTASGFLNKLLHTHQNPENFLNSIHIHFQFYFEELIMDTKLAAVFLAYIQSCELYRSGDTSAFDFEAIKSLAKGISENVITEFITKTEIQTVPTIHALETSSIPEQGTSTAALFSTPKPPSESELVSAPVVETSQATKPSPELQSLLESAPILKIVEKPIETIQASIPVSVPEENKNTITEPKRRRQLDL